MVALGTLSWDGSDRPRTCEHLEALERELTAVGVAIGPGQPCPHDPDWGTWFAVDALFDLRQIDRRLALDPCVAYEEYEGRLGGGDVTFYCTCCKKAIVGRHPRSASPATPLIT
jgi:hypothetical protein